MRNVTLAIEDDVLQKARIRAVKEGTTVNEVIRRYLAEYAAREESLRAVTDRILEASAKYHGRIKGGSLRREDIYDRGARRGR
jgi:hypothetical protein